MQGYLEQQIKAIGRDTVALVPPYLQLTPDRIADGSDLEPGVLDGKLIPFKGLDRTVKQVVTAITQYLPKLAVHDALRIQRDYCTQMLGVLEFRSATQSIFDRRTNERVRSRSLPQMKQ